MIKVAFAGRTRSGKSSACAAFIKFFYDLNLGHRVANVNLADELKKLCRIGLGNTERQTLQIFGTDIVREGCKKYFGNEDFWVNILLHEVKGMTQLGWEYFCCGDVRFWNEVKILHNNGWKIVWLDCDDSVLIKRGATEQELYHKSEKDLLKETDIVGGTPGPRMLECFDEIWDGSMSLEELNLKVKNYLINLTGMNPESELVNV